MIYFTSKEFRPAAATTAAAAAAAAAVVVLYSNRPVATAAFDVSAPQSLSIVNVSHLSHLTAPTKRHQMTNCFRLSCVFFFSVFFLVQL